MKILDVANTEYPGWVSRVFLLQAIKNVAEAEINREVFYLKERGLLQLNGELESSWIELRITPDGIDIIEGKSSL